MSTNHLEIRLLGELAIVLDGQRLVLPASKRTRALLGYLIATGRPHLRDRLCELLWPDPDDPRAALRWSLTKLRGLVDIGAATRIHADREHIAFEPAGAGIDLARVRQLQGSIAAASTERLRAACGEFRGDLLEGLDLPDCYQFHEWCSAERETARGLRISMLDALVARLRGSDIDREEALTFARTRIAIDPLAEEAHVTVVRLLTDLGRTREASAQIETCKRILERELGRKPSAALFSARTQLAPEPTLSAPVLPPQASERAEAPVPLVGRAAERSLMVAAVQQAKQRDHSKVLLFVGEPGIGKTRLLEELAGVARAAGGVTLSARAFEGERGRPYGAWIDALQSDAAPEREARGDAALARELAPLLPKLQLDAGELERTRLFQALQTLLERIARGHALVCVVLDDVQWLDDASAALIHFIARSAARSGILLACGARPEELADNDATEPLFRTLAREGLVARTDLSGLAASDVITLACAIDPAIDSAVVVKESAGNALFALEVSRALTRGAETKSESLSDLIADRLARVREDARDLLPWAAAIGHAFAPEMLAKLTAAAPALLDSAVHELERKRILREVGAGYDFVHDLVRAAAYRRLSEPRRRLIHLHIARTLDTADAPDALAGEIARHAALGGDHARAASAYLTAAERCLRLVAYEEAAQLAQCGIPHARELAPGARIALHISLLRAYVTSGKWLARAPAVKLELSRLLQAAPEAGLDERQIAQGHFLLATISREHGDLDTAHRAALQAADTVRGADPATTARTLADTARCLALIERDMERALSLLAEAEAIALAANVKGLTDLDWGYGLAFTYTGQYDAARLRLMAALAGGRDAENLWCECECLLQLATLELEVGRPADTIARCAELVPLVAKIGEGTEGPAAAVLEALARRAAGEADADAKVEAAIAKLREIDAKGYLAYALNMAAEQDVTRGDLESACSRAREALRAASAVQRASQCVIARGLLARVAWASGDRAEARSQLDSVAADMVTRNQVSARARALIAQVARDLGDSNAG